MEPENAPDGTRSFRTPIPLRNGPEYTQHIPEIVTFLDRQFEMWVSPAPYRLGRLASSINAETNPEQTKRPGKSEAAKEWEATLANTLAQSSPDIVIEDNPYQDIFDYMRDLSKHKPVVLQAVETVEQLYLLRMSSLTKEQLFAIGPPDDVVTILTILKKELYQ